MRSGYKFTSYTAQEQEPFDKLFDVFKELIIHTSGDFDEAIDWLKELDREYGLTSPDYSIEDFIEDLRKRGYIRDDMKTGDGKVSLTGKFESILRQSALEQIFSGLQRSGSGQHSTALNGLGDEQTGEFREFRFGDALERISVTESLRRAQIVHGIDELRIEEQDIVVEDTFHKSQLSTVLMIDISHSMILYGEDRITPAKKVAMALAELIRTRYPKDTLDIIVFGNDAWPVTLKDLPYLQVGPYHTNTVAGLQLAMDILRRKRNTNKQIFMITDGKPSCYRRQDGTYYFNSNGLDNDIVHRCYAEAQRARRLHIPITTFMIARDPYLQQFVSNFSEANQGKAYYAGIKGLGNLLFKDYTSRRMKNGN